MFDTKLTASLIYNMLLLCSLEVFIAYARMGPVWTHVRSKWCLVWKLFRAYTTSCVRAGGLPWVSVLEVCSEHTWFNFAHRIVKPMFRAYTTRRVRAKRSPKTVLFRAYTTDCFPGFSACISSLSQTLEVQVLTCKKHSRTQFFFNSGTLFHPKAAAWFSSMFVNKARAIPKTKLVQPAVDRLRWFLLPFLNSFWATFV